MFDEKNGVVAVLLGGISAVAGVVTVLWAKLNAEQARREQQVLSLEKRSNECEEDRRNLWVKIAELRLQYGSQNDKP